LSIATNPKLSAFYRWLHTRPLPEDPRRRYTQGRLAKEAVVGRCHLSLVLAGRRKGDHTWLRLIKVLPMDGLCLLKQCPAWNNFAEKAYAARLEEEGLHRAS
jgi:hypothetical protein